MVDETAGVTDSSGEAVEVAVGVETTSTGGVEVAVGVGSPAATESRPETGCNSRAAKGAPANTTATQHSRAITSPLPMRIFFLDKSISPRGGVRC